jgi:hypothetical protein
MREGEGEGGKKDRKKKKQNLACSDKGFTLFFFFPFVMHFQSECSHLEGRKEEVKRAK